MKENVKEVLKLLLSITLIIGFIAYIVCTADMKIEKKNNERIEFESLYFQAKLYEEQEDYKSAYESIIYGVETYIFDYIPTTN